MTICAINQTESSSIIVVTTPTGNIGRHVVRHLLDTGKTLRLIMRDPSTLAPEVRDRVEVVAGSHGDAPVVDRAFRGADAVFWLCPPIPAVTPAAATVDFPRPGADAMRRRGIDTAIIGPTSYHQWVEEALQPALTG